MKAQDHIVETIMKRMPFVLKAEANEIADEILSDIAIETLRDKFARQISTVFVARIDRKILNDKEIESVAHNAYRVADAMIVERSKS